MKTFLVTRTTVETQTVTADSETAAINFALDPNSDPAEYLEITTFKVAEKLAAPEYRVIVAEDADYASTCETKRELNLVSKYGVYGYTVEKRTTVDGKWEHVDSCWGFLGNDDYGFEQAADAIPEGIEAAVYCGNTTEGARMANGRVIYSLTGTMKVEAA